MISYLLNYVSETVLEIKLSYEYRDLFIDNGVRNNRSKN